MNPFDEIIKGLLKKAETPRKKTSWKEDKQEIKDALKGLGESYLKMEPHEKETVQDFFKGNAKPLVQAVMKVLSQEQYVFTHPTAIVTYTVTAEKDIPNTTLSQVANQNLKRILDVNKNANLADYQVALGITIVKIEKNITPDDEMPIGEPFGEPD